MQEIRKKADFPISKKKKYVPLKLSELPEKLLIGVFFLIKSTKFEKPGSIKRILNSLGNLIFKFHFRS